MCLKHACIKGGDAWANLDQEVPHPQAGPPRDAPLVHRLQVLQSREGWSRAELLHGSLGWRSQSQTSCCVRSVIKPEKSSLMSITHLWPLGEQNRSLHCLFSAEVQFSLLWCSHCQREKRGTRVKDLAEVPLMGSSSDHRYINNLFN